jgi:AAA family ATPase
LNTIVHKTQGFSGAEIVNICNEAALLAIREEIERQERGANEGEQMLVLKRKHVRKALDVARPRIAPETVRFYDEFERKMKG